MLGMIATTLFHRKHNSHLKRKKILSDCWLLLHQHLNSLLLCDVKNQGIALMFVFMREGRGIDQSPLEMVAKFEVKKWVVIFIAC